MYGTRSKASTESYLSTGYAAIAFVIILLIIGLIRLGWGIVSVLEICIEDYHKDEQ